MAQQLLNHNGPGPSHMSIIDFCEDVKRDQNSLGSYYIIRIVHYKRPGGVEHEFLVVDLRNNQTGVSSMVCLERGRGPAERWWHVFSSLEPAKDLISRWPKEKEDSKPAVKTERFIPDSKDIWKRPQPDNAPLEISIVRVSEQNTFPLRDLVLILRLVTGMAPLYNLKRHQCYWFCWVILELASTELSGLYRESGRDAERAGKWGDQGVPVLDIKEAREDLRARLKAREDELSDVPPAVTAIVQKVNEADVRARQEARYQTARTVREVVQKSRLQQEETEIANRSTINGALQKARAETEWNARVNGMPPISRAFAKASKEVEEVERAPKERWDDGSWAIGTGWTPKREDVGTTRRLREMAAPF